MKYRKILAAALIACFVFALPVEAQNPWSTAAMQAWKQSITAAGYMGAPRFTTAAAPTCSAANVSALIWDTTLAGLYVCNGSAYVAAGGTGLSLNTAQTPDALYLATDALSNSFILAESADSAFDFAHAQATDPELFIHSHNQNTTQWIGLFHNATNGVVDVGTGAVSIPDGVISKQGTAASPSYLFGTDADTGYYSPGGDNTLGLSIASRPRYYSQQSCKTLTESAATGFIRIAVTSGAVGGGYVSYSIESNDGTDYQARSGVLPYSVVNKAGTETCTVGSPSTAVEVVAVSAGTLTNTFTCNTAPTNAIDIEANAVSSLTQTTLRICYSVYKDSNDSGAFAGL